MKLIAAIRRELRHPDYPSWQEVLQVLGIVLLLSAPDLLAR